MSARRLKTSYLDRYLCNLLLRSTPKALGQLRMDIPIRSISFTGYNGIRNWMAYSNLQDITGYHPAKLKNYGFFEPYLNTNIGRNLFKMLNV